MPAIRQRLTSTRLQNISSNGLLVHLCKYGSFLPREFYPTLWSGERVEMTIPLLEPNASRRVLQDEKWQRLLAHVMSTRTPRAVPLSNRGFIQKERWRRSSSGRKVLKHRCWRGDDICDRKSLDMYYDSHECRRSTTNESSLIARILQRAPVNAFNKSASPLTIVTSHQASRP